MLKKRIIPCLDVKNGQTVKGVQFEHLRFAGDPLELAKRYEQEGADELVFLDIEATVSNKKTQIELVENIAKVLSIPFTIGGGISSIEDAKRLLSAGADKIAINSAALLRPELIQELSQSIGKQCVVVAMDIKQIKKEWLVFSHGGRKCTNLLAKKWAKRVELYGAGEILLTSMSNDGEKRGFACEITKEISEDVSIPIIASGGAGKIADFTEVFQKGKADAALAASMFHFNELTIPHLKRELYNEGIPVRL